MKQIIRNRYIPSLETLESRCNPATGISVHQEPSSLLIIYGTPGDDVIRIEDDGLYGNRVSVYDDEKLVGIYAVKNLVLGMIFNLGDGNDMLDMSKVTGHSSGGSGEGGNDTIIGSDGPDLLNLLSGDDGDDMIYGGSGTDWMGGDSGDDYLSGGAGDDRLVDIKGFNTLLGGAGDDLLVGGSAVRPILTPPVETPLVQLVEPVAPVAETTAFTESAAPTSTVSTTVLVVPVSQEIVYHGWYSGSVTFKQAEPALNVMEGGDGNDTILGYHATDTLIGFEKGTDTFIEASEQPVLQIASSEATQWMWWELCSQPYDLCY